MSDIGPMAIVIIVCVAVGFFIGILVGFSISPTMKDVVTLDNQRCILVYENDLVHKFCEAE